MRTIGEKPIGERPIAGRTVGEVVEGGESSLLLETNHALQDILAVRIADTGSAKPSKEMLWGS